MTTSPVDVSRPRASAPPAGTGLGASLAAAEVGLTFAEALLVSAPALSLAGQSLRAGGEAGLILPLLGALLVVSWVRAADTLRPVVAARAAKSRGQAISAAEAEAAQRAISRAPLETAVVRWIVWTVAAVVLAVRLVWRDPQAWPSAMGVACIGFLHAGGIAAVRSLVWERVLGRARRTVLPNFDPLRAFAESYRRRLWQTAWALLAIAHAVNAALVAVFTDMTSRQSGTLLALTVPALAIPMLSWYGSLLRRTRSIERYFDAAIRRPGTRGPAREDPGAVAAFQAAQRLPYRLAGYQALASAFAGVAVVVVGRRFGGFDTGTAGRLLGATGLMVLAMALYEVLFLRDVLRPLLAQLGSRHRLPVAEIRSPIALRTKLVVFFGSVTVFASGLVLLFAVSPTHARATATMIGSVMLALSLALGLVLLIVRDLVTPIRALEERSDEMARGELARPVPPSGEADEIGRLTFAFEEMRRALRDKLRSTESLNIDLEREVRRRTEVLEQRNVELREALEKLRRAQDDLIRTEKLASMGRLVAGIAHEINNPVNAVINTLGPLEEAIGALAAARTPDDAAAAAATTQEMLRVVQRGAARSKAIVQALHNYSRGDEEMPREVTLARSIDDTLDLLRHRLKNIRVEKQVDAGIRLMGFAGQIDQVFMNLFTNAAQAIGDRPQGGTIRIAASRRDDDVDISVSDDGPGIPPDVVPRIFDPFFTTKDVGEGSGLGLSIVHGIIDRHGGRIQVESRVGEGTTFVITLPVRGRPAPSASGSDDKMAQGT